MQVASSIQIPKRVDPKRKQLVKQLQNDIKSLKKVNISTPKRKPSQDYQDYQSLDTLKKKQHMDHQAIRHGKQNHRSLKQNDRIFAPKPHQIPIKPCINPQLNSHIPNEASTQRDQTVRKELGFILPNLPVLFPMMLDQLIPNLKDPNLGIFTDKERLLFTIQQKLDNYLLFIKENRKKKKGQFFSVIKRSFLQNERIFLEFSHIKKILFVDSNLYKVQKFGEGVSMECLIDIKLKCNNSDTKAMQLELRQRKNTFPQKLFTLKQELKNTTGEEKVQIPEVKFEFQAKVQASKAVMKASLKNILEGEMFNKKKINKFFVLQSKDSREYQIAKKILLTGIKRVETIIKKQTQIDMKLFQKKIKQEKQLNQKQIESIIEEINFIYRSKSVTNLMFDQLIEALSKKLIMSLEVFKKCIQIFIQVGPKINNLKPFLRSINHKNGRIIQIERSSINQFKIGIVRNEEWMKRFKFDLQMSTEQVRKKLEAERTRVFNEVKDTSFDEEIKKVPALKSNMSEINQMAKIDFSQVRRFVESQKKEDIDVNQSSEENEEEIGIQSKLYLQTLAIIKSDRLNARRARRADQKLGNQKIQELLKSNLEEKKPQGKKAQEKKLSEKKLQQKKDMTIQKQQKQEFKSTLSNSDGVFYDEEDPVDNQRDEQQ